MLNIFWWERYISYLIDKQVKRFVIVTQLKKLKLLCIINFPIKACFLYVSIIWVFASNISIKKSAKFISGHSKLFIMPMTNPMRCYLLSVMISLTSKTPSYFGNRGLINLWWNVIQILSRLYFYTIKSVS